MLFNLKNIGKHCNYYIEIYLNWDRWYYFRANDVTLCLISNTSITFEIRNFERSRHVIKLGQRTDAFVTINKHNLTKNIMWEIVKLSDNLNNDFERSHDLFRGAFIEGFPWELLKVLSGTSNSKFCFVTFGKGERYFVFHPCYQLLVIIKNLRLLLHTAWILILKKSTRI